MAGSGQLLDVRALAAVGNQTGVEGWRTAVGGGEQASAGEVVGRGAQAVE